MYSDPIDLPDSGVTGLVHKQRYFFTLHRLSQGDRGDSGPRGLAGFPGSVGPAGVKVC